MTNTTSRRWILRIGGALAAILIALAVRDVASRREQAGSTAPATPPGPAPAVAPSSLHDRPTLWILAFGVSRYADPSLRLRFAAADAQAVTRALAAQRGGPLYGAVSTAVLVDAEVTRSSILHALDDFFGRAAPIDVGVIYMAGHGVHDAVLDSYYFLPATASAERPRIEGLDMDDFNRQLRLLHRNLRQLVVILDTCHAGAAAGGTDGVRLGEDLAARLPPAEGLYILAAAKSGEQSREAAALGHGAFTQALLDGLRGAAADADGLIRVLGLAAYAARVVPHLTENAQTPYLSIVGADLPLAVHPDRFAHVTPPPLPTPAAVAGAARRERVAVMEFENLRPDPEHDWMRQALGEQFTTALHQIPRFEVYDERMVRFLARGAADPIEASRRADMTKLVSGAYWVNHNAISITAHVKDTNPLRAIASAQVDGPLERFSELTSQVVVSLLEQMRLELSAAEIEQLLRRRTTDLAARKLLFDAERPGAEATQPYAPPATHPDPHASLSRRLLGLLTFTAISYAADVGDPEAGVRAALEGYRRAFEREDLDALARYYAEFTAGQRAALQRYFENADKLHIAFSDIQVALIGDQAAVSFNREDHFVDHRSGESQQVIVRVTKLFAKGEAGWKIVPEP